MHSRKKNTYTLLNKQYKKKKKMAGGIQQLILQNEEIMYQASIRDLRDPSVFIKICNWINKLSLILGT